MRRNKKRILKQTISFVSALSFIASSNLYGISVIADTQGEPEISITDEKEHNDEKNGVTNEVEDETKERNIVFNVVDSDLAVNDLFYDKNLGFENNFFKNIHSDKSGDICHVSINGKDDASLVYVDKGVGLESFINYIDINDGKNKIVVFNHTVIYKVDIDESGEKCTFTAYYRCDIPEDKLSVSTENSEDIIEYGGISYYKYNTELRVTPELGWNYKDQGTQPYLLRSTGYLELKVYKEYGEDAFIRINESVPSTKSSWSSIITDYDDLHLCKSYFNINLEADDYVSNCCFKNSSISGKSKYAWASMNINDQKSLLTFEIPEERNVYQVTVNGELQIIENNTLDLSSILSDDINKDISLKISIKTNPKKFHTIVKDEEDNNIGQFIFNIEDGKVCIPYIKTINNELYRLLYCGYNNTNENISLDSIIKEINNNRIYNYIDFIEEKKLNIVYACVNSSDKENLNKYTVGDEYIEGFIYKENNYISIRNKQCYSSLSPRPIILQTDFLEDNYFFTYSTVKENNNVIISEITENLSNNRFAYIFTPFKGPTTKFISINMLHTQDSELYSDFSEPVNVYYDKHAPNLKITKIHNTWAGNDVKGVYSYDFTVDDREEAPENASDEIKKIYDEIINAPTENLSEIKSITIGEYKFTNNDGSWEKECLVKADDGEEQAEGEEKPEVVLPEYDVSLVYHENGKFTANIELTDAAKDNNVTALIKEIPVYAEDICGNVSLNADGDVGRVLGDGQTRGGVPVQIDIDNPKLPQMDVSGVRCFLGMAVKQKDQELRVEAVPYDDTSLIDESKTKLYFECDGKDIEFTKESGSGSYVLDCSELQDTSGYIKLVTCDYSGNTASFYYCSGMSVTRGGEKVTTNYSPYLQLARPVFIDTAAPDAELSVSGTTEYKYPQKYDDGECLTYSKVTEKGGYEKWYSRYPDINLYSADVNSTCSGIDYITININNQRIDIPSEKLNGITSEEKQYYIHFEPKEDKSEFTATLRQPEGDETELFEGKLDGDGKLEVSVTAYDRAGNESATTTTAAYIDNNDPQSDTQLTLVKNPQAKITRFGTFSNSQLKIEVNVSDMMHSSGLCAAVLSFAGKEYEDLDIGHGTAEFTVPDVITDKSVRAEDINITVYDNVGNRYTSESLVSSRDSSLVIIETKAPTISEPVIEGENEFIRDSKRWYSSDVTVTYKVNETIFFESGIALINGRFTKNGVKYESSRLHNQLFEKLVSGISQTEPDEENAVFGDQIELSTLEDQDGDYTFFVETYDNANNRSEDSVTVYKDNTAPVIKGFVYDDAGKTAPIIKTLDCVTADDMRDIVFGHFLQNQTTLTVIANDVDTDGHHKAASSGIQEITCVMLDAEDDTVTEHTVSEKDMKFDPVTSEYSADFVIPQNFKGTFSAYAVDNVQNKSECVLAEGMIIENSKKHSETSSLDIIMPDTQYTDIDGLPLYKEPFTARVEITDKFSGLNESEIRTIQNGTNQSKKISLDKAGKISGDEQQSWKTLSSQRNLTTDISRDILCNDNYNGNSIKLSLKDNCSNTSETPEKRYSIDTTAPVIKVMYGGASADKKYTNIYNGNRTVTIEINERNFDPTLVKIEGVPGHSEWSLVSGNRGTDSAVYRATAEFKEDGKYSFTVNCSDRCDNKAAEYRSEEFIIDKTLPVLNVSYDNDSVENGKYYGSSRTATLRIKETNFDPSRINITAADLLSEMNKPVISQWKETNGVYQATVSFKNDGQYTFEVTGSDKAGNAMKGYTDSFFIDSKKPDITISGIKAANKGDVRPVINFSDKYLDTDTVKITLNGSKRGDDLELNGEFRQTESGYVFTAENFVSEKEIDDVYTLVAQAADNANNVSSQKQIFSVNRFGSNFIFDEETQKIKNKYIPEEQAVTVYEIDADKHDEEPMILVIKNAETRKLEKGSDYTIECTGGDGDWYQYTYTISEDNFTDDAAYAVEIYTHDEAGNSNNSVSEEKNAELLFGVDKTPPICTAIDFDTNGSYKADTKKAHVIIDDNIIVKGIDVYLNGNKTVSTLKDNNCEFSIPSSKTPQIVKLIVSDMADNTSEYVFKNILVSTSIVRVLVHETWFKIVIAATAVTTAAAAAFVRSRRKRKLYDILNGRME